MDAVLKQITLPRIQLLVAHNTNGYTASQTFDFNEGWSELYSNLLQFYYQYNLKSKLYNLGEIKTFDFERTNPLFRLKIEQKNKMFISEIFSGGVGNNQKLISDLLDFLLDVALEKFLPLIVQLSVTQQRNPAPLVIFKIIKCLLKYSLLNTKQITKLLDILVDKSAFFEKLEQLFYEESRSKKEEKTLKNLDLWAEVLIKYRQYMAEIFIMIFFYQIDHKLKIIIQNSLNLELTFLVDPVKKKNEDNLTKEDLTKEDVKMIENLKSRIDFNAIGVFDQERAENYMRVFLGYVISSPRQPPGKLSAKLKNMVRIFLDFVANVNDSIHNSLNLMNFDDFNLLQKTDFFGNEQQKSDQILKSQVSSFVSYCNKKYMKELEDFEIPEFIMDFECQINQIYLILKDIYKGSQELILIQEEFLRQNFLWILLNVILKYNTEMNQIQAKNQAFTEKILSIFDFCLFKNMFFQNMMMQYRFIKLLILAKEKSCFLIVEILKKAFDSNPSLMIFNEKYLSLFLNYCEKPQLPLKDEDANIRLQFFGLISLFLEWKYYTGHSIPEYDLICLNTLLNPHFTEEEFLKCSQINALIKDKSNKKNFIKIELLKQILNIIAKSTSKRFTQANYKTLKELFPLDEIKILLANVGEDYQMKLNIFRLFRNIYIFDKDNIMDDENRIYELVRPMIGGGKKPPQKDNPKEEKKSEFPSQNNTGELKLKTSSEPEAKGKTSSENQKKEGAGKGRGDAVHSADFEKIVQIVVDEFDRFLADSVKFIDFGPEKQKEKNMFSNYGVTMLISTLKYLSVQEIDYRLLTMRRANVVKAMAMKKEPWDDLCNESPIAKKLLFDVCQKLTKNEDSLREILKADIDKVKKKYLFEDMELAPLPSFLKEEVKRFDEMIDICAQLSGSKEKEEYLIYDLTTSTKLIKRYSNKLEERKSSVLIPFEILKKQMSFKKLSPGSILACFYESFKIDKISCNQTLKIDYECKQIFNVYMSILQKSDQKNDFLAKNLCEFLFIELGGGVSLPMKELSPRHQRSPSIKKRFAMEENKKQNEKEEVNSFEFASGKRNKKYNLIEIFCNIFFSASEIMQKYLLNLMEKDKQLLAEIENPKETDKYDLTILEIIWKELLLNLSFSYNRIRQDKLWKESSMRTIILIKLHQYLCEEDNKDFKMIIRLSKVKTKLAQPNERNETFKEDIRFEHIKNIFGRFWFRNDWSKKNFIIIKRSFMFPIAQAFFEFLIENMSGPNPDNQILIINTMDFKNCGAFLDTFEPSISEKLKNQNIQNEDDIAEKDIKHVQSIDVHQMNELKMTICDFFLTCCEGHLKDSIEPQLKKINFTEILETIVRLIKALAMKFLDKPKMTYHEYRQMKDSYKSSGFNQDQTRVLDMAMKLFVYMKILAEHSSTLHHLLETKKNIAVNIINNEKHSFQTRNLQCCKRRIERDNNEEEDELDMEKNFEECLSLKFLGSFAKKIEIITGDPLLQDYQKEYLFFEPNPKFSFLTQETKDEFLKNVDRTSHETKIQSLIAACTYFEQEISVTEKIKQKHPKLSAWFPNFYLHEKLLTLFCLLINSFIIFDYKDVNGGDFYYSMIVDGLGVGLFCCSIFLFSVWMIVRYPIEKETIVVKYCEKNGCVKTALTKTELFQLTFDTILDENWVRVLFIHIFCSFFGVTVSRGFFAIEVFAMINLSETFRYLTNSISLHYDQLIFTFLIIFLYIYVFSVFIFLYFQENMASDTCNSIIECFFENLTNGLTNGQGIVAYLIEEQMTANNYERFFAYVFINIMFFITVNCISLNLVLGIIVDTFGQLREKNAAYG